MYLCICVYMYTYVYQSTFICAYVYIYICISIYICLYVPGGPIEARDQASENDSISRQSEHPSRDAGGDTSTNKICRSHEQDLTSAPRAVAMRLARR